jgi:LemA protein
LELWIGLGVVAVLAIFVIITYNRLVGGRNQTQAAWRQIDVQLKRRHDLLPNLVETVKDSMSYEQETLEKVIEARSKAMGATTRSDTIAAEGALGAAVSRFMAVMEAYPNLRAQDNIGALMEELSSTENRIAFSRQHYNDSVLSYNNAVQSFPANLVAGTFGFQPAEYFEVPEAETKPIKVDLR